MMVRAKPLFGALALLLAPAFVPSLEPAYQPSVQPPSLRMDAPGFAVAMFDQAPRWLSLRALAQSAAGELPRLEFASGCRAGGNKDTQDRCVRDEESARAKLATEWGTFPHGDRTSCTQLARLGGGLQSYVELLTCLEMAKEARALPKESKE
jgi:hypothetical protein